MVSQVLQSELTRALLLQCTACTLRQEVYLNPSESFTGLAGTIVERWLEHRLEGAVALRGPDGTREVPLRGIADRVDLLSDGTFRVIDYKTSRASGPLQIAMYATALRQRLAAYRGRAWVVGEAVYVAFRDDPFVKSFGRTSADLDAAIAREEARALAIVEAIERGEFPPRPAQRSLCTTCAWAGVCRKDYVEADQPEPAV